MGKLIGEARAEVELSANILAYYAQQAETMLASRRVETTLGQAHVESSPLGPIFAIEPWNYPYYQLARVAGPNLMAGNTVLVKHAPGVPGCALAFEKVFADAGARGAYTNVFASDEQAATIIADTRIRGVALTGSGRAGSSVAASAGKALKKSTMELGGSDAFIVLDDADVPTAVGLAVTGRMMNTGQACAGAKRFIVHERLADEFCALLQAELRTLTPGDPSDDRTTLAPLSSERALDLALEQVQDAVTAGAVLVEGGQRINRTGYFMQPTILTDIKPTNPAFTQEFFAPVAMIFRVGSDDEAIELANDSPLGLGGSVITSDTDRGRKIAGRMDTGMVFINNVVVTAPELPFGGIKNSGFGRELSDLGISEFVNKKLVSSA